MAETVDRPESDVLGSTGKRGWLSYVGVAGFLLLWVTLSCTGWISALVLPSPLRVLGSVGDVGFPLLQHIAATCIRVCGAYCLGVGLGVSIGVLMQFNRVAFQFLDGLIETFRPIPPVALIPFFILVFGFAEVGKILITVLGVAVLITVTTVEAIERVSPGLIRWGLVLGLPRRQLFRLVILPAAWPEMRGGFRIALALAITLVVVSEFMGARFGLGYLLSVSKVTLTTPTILMTVMILGWLGWTLDRLQRALFDITTAWDVRAKGARR